ncbi:hypothetical protein [Amycolatopsis antarctica]|nr:hypothetical protein [Amycolatopsis antarctica]
MIGTAPLLMHNVRLADDQDPYVKAIKKLTAKKTKKTDDDKMEIDRLSFAGGMYHDDDLGPYLPAENIFRCLMEAGSLTRSGKKIERGVIFDGTRARLNYDGPRDLETLWGDDGASPFVDRRMVAVQRQRIPRVRPIFPDWSATIGVEIDPQVIDFDEFEDIVAKAGRLIGIGDYRRFYGKFEGKVTG